ncbi:MAG: hypothetical protein V9H26_26420 [Verrucomicrobiota bacterium]
MVPRPAGQPDSALKASAPANSKGLNTDRQCLAVNATASPERIVTSCLLFVATAPDWHQGVERELRAQQPEWECLIARDVAQAVKALRAGRFLAVVMNATVADRCGICGCAPSGGWKFSSNRALRFQ